MTLLWRKGSRSGSSSNCVEVAKDPRGDVWVRNSHDPDGPRVKFTPAEYNAFTGSVGDGELGYDQL